MVSMPGNPLPAMRAVSVCEVTRSGRVESVHLGCAAIADSGGSLLAQAGDASLRTYVRSAAKPIQLLAMLEAGLDPGNSLDSRSLAIMAASHGGEPGHVDLVRSLLDKAGLESRDLRCGPAEPLENSASRRLLQQGTPADSVHNNCSGKHTAMLWTCRHRGWPTSAYLEPNHPLQQSITSRVAELAGEEPQLGIDGCSVPTFFLSVAAAARMMARFSELAERPGPAARVFSAMTQQPWFTSGTSRLPYLLMAGAPGLLAKEGAEGFFVVGIPADRSPWGRAAGFAMKVLDGSGEGQRGREPGVVSALMAAGVLSSHEVARLKHLSRPPLTNASGRVVGETVGTLLLKTDA